MKYRQPYSRGNLPEGKVPIQPNYGLGSIAINLILKEYWGNPE